MAAPLNVTDGVETFEVELINNATETFIYLHTTGEA